MSCPDGVFSSPAPPFLPPLQTNQYHHSLAFHRKDYREIAIKGLASITSLISKPLKDSGSLGLGPRTWCPVTAREVSQSQDHIDFKDAVELAQPTQPLV